MRNWTKPVYRVTANDPNSGLYDAVKYLIYHVIKDFIAECFIKIYSNSNFDNITDANISAINEESEINGIVTTLDDLI